MNKATLYKISYGIYVISSRMGDRLNGQIANTVFQVSSEPPTIAVSINKQNLTHEFIKQSGVLTVSILLKDTPMNFIGNFGFKSGREIDKFKDIPYKKGVTGAPLISENSAGYIEATVINSVDAGTHTIFIGKVVEAEILKDAEPMTYAYYHFIKGGMSPKTAPTYIKEEKPVTAKAPKYKCSVCGYIYDPEKGDPDGGISPGTPFEKLPVDWVCPVCGASKEEFEKED